MATGVPMRMIAPLDGLSFDESLRLAQMATNIARRAAPKLSGAGAKRLYPVHGHNYFGIAWEDSYMWYQEMGIQPFTMTALEGKTIPMWIDDPTGTERTKNPNAETRITASGKQQVLIFRRVGSKGSTKKVKRNGATVEVPNRNFPGSAGRIGLREARRPFTTPGKLGGAIAKGNVGVKWRHPGLSPRHFLLHGIQQAAYAYGLNLNAVVAVHEDGHRELVSA